MAFPPLPREPKPGQAVRATDFIMLIRRVKSITPAEGPDIAISGGLDGWIPRLKASPPRKGGLPSATTSTWPFKGYKIIKSGVAYIQINGGDGSLASLTGGTGNGIACVNGEPTDTATGSPPVYPLLTISGNGVVYVKEWLDASGNIEPGSSSGGTGVDVIFDSSLPAGDSNTPPRFGIRQLGTVTGYAVIDGKPDFNYNDAVGPVGITTSGVCGNAVTIT